MVVRGLQWVYDALGKFVQISIFRIFFGKRQAKKFLLQRTSKIHINEYSYIKITPHHDLTLL